MDMSSRGHGTHAHRHDVGHIASVQYAPVLVCDIFTIVQFIITFLTILTVLPFCS